MFVMGTAGHIDHGKTTLITALTGINPDRLQEEQSRGMTVDLGFAWFSLPRGNVGVVDVPGHHRLVKNMLAGVGQVDFVLLVIAADDGWMPQTQEHVEILHLYGITRGVVALTKADLVDPEWLELVKTDIQEHLEKTSLQGFPVIPVSAVSGYNLDVLKEALNDLLVSLPPTHQDDNPLLWIDRVFTIKGAGTVVTGTLLDCDMDVGMEVWWPWSQGPHPHPADPNQDGGQRGTPFPLSRKPRWGGESLLDSGYVSGPTPSPTPF